MKAYPCTSLILATLLLLGCSGRYTGDPRVAQIKRVLAEAREQYGLSAVVYGVWEGKHELVEGALGMSTPDIPAHTQMHYRAGGVTEMMLTTIMLKLIEEKTYGISLDDPLAKWFPHFPHAKQVTLRMLSNSTSGYYDYLHSEQIQNDKELFTKNWDPLQLVTIGVTEPILFTPGSQFNYSHTNFCILGLVLEKITRRSLEQLVDTYIAKPLNLKNTRYTSALPAPALHSYVTENGVFYDATNWTPTWAGPSGLVISNLPELGRWMHAFGKGRLLSKESYQALTTAVPTKNPGMQFALGFGVSNGWYFQTPNINGYKTIAAYFKPRDISLVITVTDGEKSDPATHYAKLIAPKIVQILAPNHPLATNPQ